MINIINYNSVNLKLSLKKTWEKIAAIDICAKYWLESKKETNEKSKSINYCLFERREFKIIK